MNWHQRWKTRKQRKRRSRRGRHKRMDTARSRGEIGWAEMDRQEALSFWTKTNGMK